MKILTDLHCHTIASTHAYSTIKEMADHASEIGLEAIAMTDHAPMLPDGAHLYHFQNMHSVLRRISGVVILRGVECSIMGEDGKLDLPQNELEKLEIVIASLHNPVFSPKNSKEKTNALLNVIENPLVDILGHIGRDRTDFDIDAVVKKAKQYDKLIEINAHSFHFGENITQNCLNVAEACKRHDVPIVVNSDSHFYSSVGDMECSLKLLESIDFDPNLVMNKSLSEILVYLGKRKNIII